MYSTIKLYNLVNRVKETRRAWGTSCEEVLSRTENIGYTILTVTKFRPGQESVLPIVQAEVLNLIKR